MKKSVKIAFLVASLLCAVGVVVCTVGLFAIDFDLSKLDTRPIETNTHEVTEDFSNISIQTDTADVIFVLSEEDTCRVVCRETEKLKHSVAVEGDSLVIKVVDTRRWYDHIGFFFGKTSVTVYLPKTAYNNLSIETDTGDVEMPEGFQFGETYVETDTGDVTWNSNVFGDFKITTDTGDVSLDTVGGIETLKITTDTGDVSLDTVGDIENLKISTDTGDICLNEVLAVSIRVESETGDVEFYRTVASDSITVKTDTGDVNFDHSDAVSIFVETDTGDVEGTLLSEKIFFTESDTGDIRVPQSMSGGKCEIRTDTGDIEIKIVK